ncbi:MAG: L-histidine N(alpha)-methyltransferase [Bacteroidales bacterium]|jgi:L-histidine N-alpha-methyltransferase|nr:L-histidine N(alpha)-methyltransferase [Bacteroidales bacterium]
MEIENNITVKSKGLTIINRLNEISSKIIISEIYNGLNNKRRYILPKFFYDKRGSELFEEITKLEEYYPTRTEKSIIASIGNKICNNYNGVNIIELGSGDHTKIELLIQQIPKEQLRKVEYTAVDISESAIKKSLNTLKTNFPQLKVTGIIADFINQSDIVTSNKQKIICFFGSTIGNLNERECSKFMSRLSEQMNSGDKLLLGFDMIKEHNIIEKAYNDNKNITAEFSKNILNVVNNIAGANFNPDEFNHQAIYNPKKERIEMYLKATKDMLIDIESVKESIYIKKDETIHTENSNKYNEEHIKKIGNMAGLNTAKIFTDKNNWFSIAMYQK